MVLQIDPQGNELQALRSAADWRGKRVLEVGCGNGRLAKRLVRLGASLVALDPDADLVRSALNSRPKTYRERLDFCLSTGEGLPFPAGSFEIVVFGWSL